MNKLIKFFLVYLLFSFIGVLIFEKLLFTFFQQDEWAVFGNYLYWQKANLSWYSRLFIFEQDTHIVPLTNLFFYLQFKFFGMSFPFYAMVSLIIHIFNSVLVFYLSLKLFKNRIIAFLSGFLFLSNTVSQQAVIWIGTAFGTETSTSFILLSLIFLEAYFTNKPRSRNLLLSFFCLVISLLFKETSLFIFMFFPLFWVFYKKEKKYKNFLKFITPLFFLGITYVIFRAFFLFFGYSSTSSPESMSQPNFIVYFYRIFADPLKFIAQSIIPVQYIIRIADIFVLLGYPIYPIFVQNGSVNPYVSQTIGSDLISYQVSVVILLICFLIRKYYLKIKESELAKIVPIALIFIALSSFPFIFIPGQGGYFSLIEGRHLYLTSIFSSILIAVLIYGPYLILKRKRTILLIMIMIIFLIAVYNAKQIRGDLYKQIAYGNTRKSILQKINNTYPTLPTKAVIYAESDTGFYGLAVDNPILPFQSGLGQTLLVWYNLHGENFPACFFQAKYLYPIESEGYKDCGGRGFGYFRRISSLKEAVREYSIEPKDVIAFSYNSKDQKLEDITQKVRKKLIE